MKPSGTRNNCMFKKKKRNDPGVLCRLCLLCLICTIYNFPCYVLWRRSDRSWKDETGCKDLEIDAGLFFKNLRPVK